MLYRRHLKETRRVAASFRLARARERLALCFKGKSDPASTVVVAGTGRGGTTWLAQLIATAPGRQIIFEPLHPHRAPAAGNFDGRFDAQDAQTSRYLRPDQQDPQRERFFRAVLAGEVRNWWTDQERNHRFAWRYVVKLIRANLMLAWLDERFQSPIVLIVRHPCAVVRSRLRRGWSAPLEQVLDQPALLEDHLQPYEAVARAARGDLERHAVLWAIETMVALKQMAGREGTLVFYEALCAQPVAQMRTLCDHLGLSWTGRMEEAVRKQSLARDERGILAPKEQWVGRWQRDMSLDDRDRILKIARAFDLFLYDETPYPQVGGGGLEIEKIV